MEASEPEWKRATASFLILFLAPLGVTLPSADGPDSATVVGLVLDPYGEPAAGYVVVMSRASDAEPFRSEPSDASGHYRARLPAGWVYYLTGVIAPSGRAFPVSDQLSTNELIAGDEYEVDVQFGYVGGGTASDQLVSREQEAPVEPPALGQGVAVFSGAILDPGSDPAVGFRLVLQDVVSGTLYTSDPTDEGGAYSLDVPIGGRFQPMFVIAPDGARIAVRGVPPYAATEPAIYPLDVMFVASEMVPPMLPEPAKPSGTTGTATSRKRWWKRPGVIIGIVVGGAAITYGVAAGDNQTAASPYMPY